jgi:hypothetical protein
MKLATSENVRKEEIKASRFSVGNLGRIEEHFEYVDQNLGAPNPNFVGQQEYLSGDFPVVIDALHNGSFPHQILVDSADTHQTPQEHV